MKSILKYPGAKNRLTPWICEYIPKHDVYVESFAGSLAVFFNKQRSHIETVNDIDEEIVNFFRILRDRSDELERAIEFTPFSRSEYKAAYEPSYDDLERARRFVVIFVPPFRLSTQKSRPFLMPDGFLRNVIDQILFFLVCWLRKALYLQCS